MHGVGRTYLVLPKKYGHYLLVANIFLHTYLVFNKNKHKIHNFIKIKFQKTRQGYTKPQLKDFFLQDHNLA